MIYSQRLSAQRTVTDAFRGVVFDDGVDFAMRLLSGEHGFMCQYDRREVNFDTTRASVFDLSGGRFYRAEGNPSKTKFREDTRIK